MIKFARLGGVFLVAVVATHILASTLVSQHVVGRVVDMGLTVTGGQRVASAMHDIIGMLPSYLPLIAAGFLIAFFVAARLARRAPAARTGLFILAGGAAVVIVNIALKLSFDITPVAPARTLPGLLGQGAAGAVGGALFALLAKPARA